MTGIKGRKEMDMVEAGRETYAVFSLS